MKYNHKHLDIANHSPMQQRMFFAVAKQLGYDKQEVKDRAKNRFFKNCFNELTKSDLMWLIDAMMKKVDAS